MELITIHPFTLGIHKSWFILIPLILFSSFSVSRDIVGISLTPKIQGKIITRIPFQNKSGVIVVPVKVNNSKGLNLILDSGMSGTVVVLFHKELGEEIGLEYTQKVCLGGAGGGDQKPANLVTGATVNVADIKMNNQTIVVFEESRETSSWSWDGIIGKSLFDAYVTEIDYEKSTITFYEPSDFKVECIDPAIPINLDYGFPIIETAVSIENNEKIPVKLVVDLGHRNALFLMIDSLKKIQPPPNTIEGIAGRGIQGEVPSRIGRIRQVKLGQFSIPDLPTSFLLPGSNMGISSTIADGDLGSQVLNRFTIIFDYPREQMFLIPNNNFSIAFEFNMAGLMIEQDMEGIALVRYVVRNSPAAENDIRKGDKIISINGKDIREYNHSEVYNLFRQEGSEIRLGIQRNSESFTKILKLKRLI